LFNSLLGATLLVGAVFFYACIKVKGQAQDRALVLTLVLGVIALAWCLWLMHRSPRRYVKQRIVPLAARSLKPLKPTREELASSLEQGESMGMRLAKEINFNELWAMLR
jgi:hypothetical protein